MSGASPVVATDADFAGHLAAQRDYWLLAQHGLTPASAPLRPGSDPAALLETLGAAQLRAALQGIGDLSRALITEELDNLPALDAALAATQLLAAGEPAGWDLGIATISQRTGLPGMAVRRHLARAVRRWVDDPRMVAAERTSALRSVGERVTPPPVVDSPRASTPGVTSPRSARSRAAAPGR